MSRVLQAPALSGASRQLATPDLVFDDVVTAALGEAYARGRREGEAAGRAAAHADAAAAAREQAERALAGLRTAFAETAEACAGARAHQSAQVVTLAMAVTQHLLGREPKPETAVLAERVRAALELVDDPTAGLAASPEDADLLAAALSDVPGLRITADSALAPGEARLVGRWATAELTHEVAWEAIRQVLAS